MPDILSEQTKNWLNALEALLDALGWKGADQQLLQALPHYVTEFNLDAVLGAMRTLGFEPHSFHIHLNALDSHVLPCLFVTAAKEPLVIREKADVKELTQEGVVYVFQKIATSESVSSRAKNWVHAQLWRRRRFWGIGLLNSFFLSLLGLGVPLLCMAVYNQIIPSNSGSIWFSFLIGIVITLLGLLILQKIQSRLVVNRGARLSQEMIQTIFQKLLYLPPPYTESAVLHDQLMRLRDFNSLREFFTGPLINLFFDLPFALLFLLVVIGLAGSVVWIPIGTIIIWFLLFLCFKPLVRNNIEKNAKHYAQNESLLFEGVKQFRAIQSAGLSARWLERYRAANAQSVIGNFKMGLLSTVISVFGDGLMFLAVSGVLAASVFQILSGAMSVGALIAVMMIVWRILIPFRTLFVMQTRLGQLASSIRQINRLMALPSEESGAMLPVDLQGRVLFQKVSFRYGLDTEWALQNVTFDVLPGELVALCGRNSSGKSSVFKLILDLYTPQAGHILFDGKDIKQFDPLALRQAVAYVPQHTQLFYGTIEQNLRLVRPNATDQALWDALEKAGLSVEIRAMKEQLNTPLGTQTTHVLPASFLQRFSLARAYLKMPKILLLDEPASHLDAEEEKALLAALQYFKGKTTVFMISHRPSHIKLADKILLFHQGQLLLAGPTQTLLPRLPKEFLP